ncbi:MAG: YdiU family protein [Sulfurovum sp.]
MKNLTLDCSVLEKIPKRFYSKVSSQPLENPRVVAINESLRDELFLDYSSVDDFVEFINSEFIAKGSVPYSLAYSGHQFGYFVPNLGDGRALNLGKLDNYHLQLKGSGITSYSRMGDGRAILSSSIREFLMSEAMYHLNIPTTRALAMITSDTAVYRDRSIEDGSIVLRASSSWIRFGSFEFAYLGDNRETNLIALSDLVIEESYPHLVDTPNRYEQLYFEVVDKTVDMIALWQSVGFMHGVMNTDNMSIEGLTIDYGPFAFMEKFDRKFVCNLSDYDGRYSFENQPFIAQWNLLALAKVFAPIADYDKLEKYANSFIGKFKIKYFSIMSQKLGLQEEIEGDIKLISELASAMESEEIDYSSFFYNLSIDNFDYRSPQILEWNRLYQERLKLETISQDIRLEKMKKINPKYILRNYMLEDAIERARDGDYSLVEDLLYIAQNPFDEHKKFEKYLKPSEMNIKCSCSS